ncbi:plakophilin-2 [Nematolebias whitei]|uniref:plakophilin-2 n=1 Tax=Nematolebias whitei TaxID=451745 RepID=UPI00189B8C29|nr:plakophilin-2 [Nematolebias whitei]
MEERFFKSPLPALDLVLNDSSLALPTEPSPRSSTRTESEDRSLRVQRQVRLTLERKTKRNLSNGGASLQKHTARSLDGDEGFSSNTKVNGPSFISRTLSINHVKRPSRKVAMSPEPNPDLARRHFNSTYRRGVYTVPGPGHSHALATLMNSTGDSDLFHRYALLETPHGSWLPSSMSTPGTFSPSSLRQTARSRSAGFQQHAQNDFLTSRRQNAVTLSDQMFGSAQPDEDLICPAQVSGDQRSMRLDSFSPSGGRAEMDTGRPVAKQLGAQQKQNPSRRESKNKPPAMTLERAVSLLTTNDEETLIDAVNSIQSLCFQGEDAKKTVYNLHGIEKLLQLLNNDSEEVQHVAAGALRNVVYNNNENKMEVKDCDGLAIIVNTLTNSIDMETRCQLTGLMWNLSSHDVLKECFPKNTACVLTKSILVPSSGILEGENPKDELLADANAFYNATGCLRNLSSAGPDVRQAMRVCENLIDSLVYYIRGTVANQNTNDESTENCVCILNNLTFQFGFELSQQHVKLPRESRQVSAPERTSVGCFSPRSAKISQDVEQQRLPLEENPNPHGAEWLWSLITMRMYVSLVVCSKRRLTQEAAFGALLNITAENGAVSKAIAVTLFQKENGLKLIKNILHKGRSHLKTTAISLTANLSRHHELRPFIASQMLTEIVDRLVYDDLTNEELINLFHILINLSQSDVRTARAIVNQGALTTIIHSSKNNSQAGKTATVLLQTMWVHSEAQWALKKNGIKKSELFNSRTTKVMNSLK